MSKSGGRGKRTASKASKRGRPAPKRNRPAPKARSAAVRELEDQDEQLHDEAREDRREEKRQRRFERQVQEAAAARRRRRQRRMRRIGVGALVLVVVGVGVFFLFRPDPELAGVEQPRDRGRSHVNNPSYEEVAPTSGPHNPQAAPCGVSPAPVDLGLAVHALEHGTVVVWYRPEVPQEQVTEMTEMLQEWDSHWILAPNPDLEEPIVATAWNRRMRFEDPNTPLGEGDATLRQFVDTYRNRGPERVSCDVQ